MRSAAGLLALVLVALTACSTSPAAPSPSGDAAEEPTTSPSPGRASPPPGPSRSDDSDDSDDSGTSSASSSIGRITPALRQRMTASHRSGCPVPLSALRYVRVPYVGFDGETHRGELVVAARYARDVASVFEEIFEAGFPIRRMVLVDEYGGDDNRSMAANNTSAYNCRTVAGTDRWSEHASGAAIDINPVQNPYVQGASSFAPAEGARYVDVPRGPRAQPEPGVIVAGDVVVRAFARIGWEWGGTWTGSKDYQHFSAGGG